MRERVSEPRRPLARGLLLVAFAVYLVLVAWIILWKLQVPYAGGGALRAIKLVPYVAAAGDGASPPLEVAVNVILFVPFGVFLGILAGSWRWWMQLSVLVGTSVVFETVQYILAIGSSDITDVIDNTLGGVIGLGLLAWARRGSRGRADAAIGRVLLIGTGILVIAVALFVISPLQFHARRV